MAAWEAGCDETRLGVREGGLAKWIIKNTKILTVATGDEAGGSNMLPIAMPWEAGFGRRRWWLKLLAAATWEAGCGGAGSWLLWQQLKEGRWLKVIDGKE